MKKKKYPVVNIGTVSILTVFVILCMVTFAALSWLTAGRSARYNDQVRERTEAWYQAVSDAYETIAAIDQELTGYWESGRWDLAEETYTFTVPVDDTSELSVCLTTHAPSWDDPTLYTVTQFTEISTQEWEGDNSMQLMPVEPLSE